MKAFITGYKGFIGSNLLTNLTEKFETIIKVDIEIFDKKNWREYLIQLLETNKPDVVFHVGACSDTLEKDVQLMMVLNFESTKVLVDWCNNNSTPLIYSSSAANYGSSENIPSNLYAWSKYTSECYVNSNNGISLRYFNVYGPGENHKKKMASVIWQCLIHQTDKKFKLFPKTPKRDFVYIDDIVSANIHAWENFNELSGNYYDVGYGVAEPFEKIVETLNIKYKYVSEKEIPKGYQFYTCSDTKKWMRGWKPKYSLVDGINKYVETIGWKKN